MTERPILFSAPMVRAILDGSKTQTRRVAKVNSEGCKPGFITPNAGFVTRTIEDHVKYCPYGQSGDRLWVREAFCIVDEGAIIGAQKWTVYKADGDESLYKWRPSIHMPRWASRITLEITGIRVERLQDITEDDAKAEGIACRKIVSGDIRTGCRAVFGLKCDDNVWAHNARGAFQFLWESISGTESWDANPWVWVVEFKRADQ